VIRGLRAWTSGPGLRRVAGAIALAAFVMVVVLAAAHSADASAGHDDRCGICTAASLVGASESFSPPTLLGPTAQPDRVAPPQDAVACPFDPRRFPSPRGPPVLA
jgi:hypothetical protein